MQSTYFTLWARHVSRDVPADIRFVCGEAVMLGDTIKGTTCKWEVGVCYVWGEGEMSPAFNWNVWSEEWRSLGEASVWVLGQYCCGSYRRWVVALCDGFNWLRIGSFLGCYTHCSVLCFTEAVWVLGQYCCGSYRRWVVAMCVGFNWLRIGSFLGCYTHCSVLCFTEAGIFLASCANLR